MTTETEAKIKLPLEYSNGDYWLKGTTIAIDSWGKCWGISPELRTIYLCDRPDLERIWTNRCIPADMTVSITARDILTREVCDRIEEDLINGDYTPTKAKQAIRLGNSRVRLVRTTKHQPRNVRRAPTGKRLPLHKTVEPRPRLFA